MLLPFSNLLLLPILNPRPRAFLQFEASALEEAKVSAILLLHFLVQYIIGVGN
jgi:hypothetical protein